MSVAILTCIGCQKKLTKVYDLFEDANVTGLYLCENCCDQGEEIPESMKYWIKEEKEIEKS